MALTVPIDEDLKALLEEQAARSGESVAEKANHLLRASLHQGLETDTLEPFKVKPFDLDIPEKWKDLTPSQILYEMDIEEYQEHLERS